MIGKGKWKFAVDIFLYRGDIFLTISEKDGKYIFSPEIPGYKDEISYEVIEAKESGNTLHVVAAASMVPGKKTISADMTFDGDKCIARMDVPYIGKIDLNDGVRVG